MKAGATKFMIAREKFHAARTPDTATAYADAALAEKDFGDRSPAPRAAVLASVAAELRAAGHDAAAGRVK